MCYIVAHRLRRGQVPARKSIGSPNQHEAYLCLPKSPLSLRQLMLRAVMDTFLGHDVGAALPPGVIAEKTILMRALHNLCTIICRTPGNNRFSPELQARRTRESKHLH
jgi:hypothetical protein